MGRVRTEFIFARVARQQHLKSAADSVSRQTLQPSMLRCIRCRAATAPGAVQHAHMIPLLCASVCLADSTTTVMLFLRLHGGLLYDQAAAEPEGSHASLCTRCRAPRGVCGWACMGSLAGCSRTASSGVGRSPAAALQECVRGLCTGLLWCKGCKCLWLPLNPCVFVARWSERVMGALVRSGGATDSGRTRRSTRLQRHGFSTSPGGVRAWCD